ncbi:bifunctional folylpolyglutamate synthase/dihydrofolate synthase [Flavobacteriaceae bacterium]|nr:bifunctional folylpolyglutamate synthase/dihydrofolate synthase [Flavobacteriaceae bacterium]
MSQVFTTYDAAVQWLFLQLPQYQRQGAAAYKPGLERTERLMAYLKNPEHGFKSIHVAGTNGKGSTSHMLASVLQAAGFRVGLYTSPHLKDFRERIRINGVPIAESEVLDFVQDHAAIFKEMGLSFFEMTVGLAFDYFDRSKVDVAIIETGMGGRLDSTNVIVPILSLITNIGLDHMQFLGDTHQAIAREKAGIIKRKIPVVIGQYTEQTLEVFQSISTELEAPLIIAQDHSYETYECDLKGAYQEFNQKTVLTALEVLKTRGFYISEQHIALGFSQVQKSTGFMGRWQTIGQRPLIICDTAHNADGLTSTMRQLNDLNAPRLHFVLGFVADKALEDIFKLLPKAGIYYFCAAHNPRAIEASKLEDLGTRIGLKAQTFDSVHKALSAAQSIASDEDVIYVGGSTFVVAEVL